MSAAEMGIWHCLVKITPFDPVTETRVSIRLASANLRAITGLGGHIWFPAMTELPTTGIRLFDGSFAGSVEPAGARMAFNLSQLRRSNPAIDRLFWPGATVEIRTGRIGDPYPWPAHFVGRISASGRKKDILSVSCEVSDEPFIVDVLNRKYAGTGGAEGSSDLTDRPKPLIIGRASNVEPVLINATDSIYQFSGYGPIEAVTTLYERASAFGASIGDYATYAGLIGATIAPGSWASCRAEGMIRLGAPAYGVITGDVRGHVVGTATPRLTGDVLRAAAAIAGVDIARIDTETLDAMDVAAPFPINIVIDQQTNVLELAQRMALPCNHQAGISLTGKMFVTGVEISSVPVIELDTQGRRRPQVFESDELAVSPPFAETIIGAARSWRVHRMDEIATLDGTGQDGADAITAESSGPISYAVACSPNLVPKTGALAGASGTMRLRDAATGLITTGVTAFAVASTEGCAATIDSGTGAYSFSEMSALTSAAVFRCTYGGVDYLLRIALTKVADGSGATQTTDNSSVSGLSSTSYPAADSEQVDIDILIPASTTINVEAHFNYVATNPGTFVGKIKVTYQNVTDSGAETDLTNATGGTASSSFTYTDPYGGGYMTQSPSSANIATTLTNSAGASKLYRLRLYAAKSAGDTTGSGGLTLQGSY